MSLSLSSDGKIEGKYQNHAPHSPAVSENVIGSVGSGIPATLGFIVNFEVCNLKNSVLFPLWVKQRCDGLTLCSYSKVSCLYSSLVSCFVATEPSLPFA